MGLHISHTPTIIGTKLEKTQNDNIEENEAELLLSAPAKIIKKEKRKQLCCLGIQLRGGAPMGELPMD